MFDNHLDWIYEFFKGFRYGFRVGAATVVRAGRVLQNKACSPCGVATKKWIVTTPHGVQEGKVCLRRKCCDAGFMHGLVRD
jgi:hypothetical protein